MKSHLPALLIILFLNFSFKTYAQPTITAGNTPQPGQFETFQTVNSNAVFEGSSGANQTWDFSNVINQNQQDSTYYFNAASTPYFSLFPMSTLALMPSQSSISNYAYINANANFIEFNGLAYEYNGDTLVYQYVNPLRSLEFPVNYNSTMTDPFELVVPPIEFQPGTFTATHTVGTVSYTVDAWGTLITPTGMCSNSVLRIKRRTVQTDSTFTTGSITNIDVSQNYTTQYDWICANGGVGFSIVYDTTILSSGSYTQKNASYDIGLFTAVNSNENTEIDFSINPNPVTNILTVSLEAQTARNSKIRICDLTGKYVFSNISIGNTNEILDVSILVPGIYFLSVENERGKITRKFIKE